MTLARVRSVWSGPQIVGGGLSEHYFFGSTGDEGLMAAAVRTFWNGFTARILAGNSVQVQPEVVNINEGTGDVVSVVTLGSPPAVVNGGGGGDPLPPATQGLVRWLTDGIVNNRRVRGRTFIPACLESDCTLGAPTPTALSAYNAAAAALIADVDTQLMIWARPTPERAGSFHTVVQGSGWTKFAVLRSRRD